MFSAAESAEVWDRWQKGEGLKLIGRVFGRTSSSIFQHLKPHGGIRPVPRRRSRRVLSLDEREEISRGVSAGVSLRSIAARLRRAPSTVSRELWRTKLPVSPSDHEGRLTFAGANKDSAFAIVEAIVERRSVSSGRGMILPTRLGLFRSASDKER